jgi:hypothetical protein
MPFVADALDVLSDAGRVRRSAGAAADVVMHVAGTAALPGTSGTLVLLPPLEPEALPAANRQLADAGVPWRFGAPLAGEARFATVDGDAALGGLAAARLRLVYPLARQEPGADSVLLRLSDGAAWAVGGERRTGGRYILLATPLHPDASTIPVTAAMLPLLDRLTGAWAAARSPRTEHAPGEAPVVPEGADAVVRPDGTSEPVTAGAAYTLGDQPGIYRLLAGDSVIAAWAVNAPAEASDLRRLDRRGLETRLPGWSLHVTNQRGSWLRAVFRERLGTELWRPLLLAVLLALIIESIAAASGRARRSAAAAPPPPESAGAETR